MKFLRIIMIVVSFLGLLQESVFTMNIDISKIMERIYREEQDCRNKIWVVEERQKSKIKEHLEKLQTCKKLLISYMYDMPISIKLPNKKSVKDLSSTQQEAVVIFELSNNKQDNTFNFYLLSASVNILSEEIEDPVSKFILEEILERIPKDFLES